MIAIQDSVNDVTQFCDNQSLKNELKMLSEQILQLIDQNIIQGGTYNAEEVEYLVNNLGGMMQVIIVRLETDYLDDALI